MDNNHRFGLPAYIYTDDRTRAFLNLHVDVRGRWSAGYTEYADEPLDDEGFQRARTSDPVINDAKSPFDAMRKLADLRKQFYEY